MLAAAKRQLSRTEVSVLVITLLVLVLFHLLSSQFLTVGNMKVVLGIAPEVGIVAVGVAVLMIAGEFDLSVGATFALAPMLVVVLAPLGVDPVVAIVIGLAACMFVGFVNAVFTLAFDLPSFIITLGTMFVVRSVVVLLAGGLPPPLPEGIPEAVFVGWVGPFRASILWYAGIVIAASYLLGRTNLGNWIYATGGDYQAAKDLGINVNAVKTFCFVLCALLAGFAGFIQSLRVHAALTSLGTGIELEAIAAAVIGGVALRGGIGTPIGAALGALLIRLIDNGLVMARIDANWFRLAVGVLTIGAVVFNEILRRQARRMRVG
ncbi:MAG TPA: ABC transporter permease [Bauldia sp.]|nr:ABC transporter permease [Bauldia sp.]